MAVGVRTSPKESVREIQRSLDGIARNIRTGTATLDGGNPGSATVTATWIRDDTPIFLCGNGDGSGTEGWVRVNTRTAATSFTITSSANTDNQTVAWLAITL